VPLVAMVNRAVQCQPTTVAGEGREPQSVGKATGVH